MLRLKNILSSISSLSVLLLHPANNNKCLHQFREVFYLANKHKHLIQKQTKNNTSRLNYNNNNNNLIKENNFNLIDSRHYSSKKGKDKGGSKIVKPKVELRPEEINEVINYDELINGMRLANEKLKTELLENFSVRLTPNSFEQILVKTTEGNMRLGEIVQVEVKSPTLYQIDMIDTPDYVKPVFDAIVNSKLNTNPKLEGKTAINLSIPKVTRESREATAKNIRLKCAQVLKKMNDLEKNALKKASNNKKVSHDLVFNVSQYIKYQYELHAKQAADLRDSKIKEVLQE